MIERLLANLSVSVEPFALCEVEEGCLLRIDGHETVTLHFVLRGHGAVEVGRRHVEFGPGHLVLVPLSRPHVVSAIADDSQAQETMGPVGLEHLASLGDRGVPDVVSACGHLQARYGGGPALFGLLTDPIVMDFSDSEQMAPLFDDMLRESASGEPGSLAMLRALMNRCMVMMFRRLCGTEECPLPWLNALEDERMAAPLDLMLNHPGKPHSLETLAEAASMSRTAFAAEFKSRFGVPPMTFLRGARLRKAAELLADPALSISSVAARVGFSGRAHFSVAFRDQFGVSPGAYRKSDGLTAGNVVG